MIPIKMSCPWCFICKCNISIRLLSLHKWFYVLCNFICEVMENSMKSFETLICEEVIHIVNLLKFKKSFLSDNHGWSGHERWCVWTWCNNRITCQLLLEIEHTSMTWMSAIISVIQAISLLAWTIIMYLILVVKRALYTPQVCISTFHSIRISEYIAWYEFRIATKLRSM